MAFKRKTDAQWSRFDELPKAPFDPFEEHAPRPTAAPESVAAPAGATDLTALMPWMDDVLSFGTPGPARDESGTSVATRAPAAKQVAEAESKARPKGLKNDPNWTALARGAPRESWAPSSVQLPDDVVRGLEDAHRQTAADHFEHGGNIVRRGESYSARDSGAGTENSFEHEANNIGRGNTYVGTYHTHPDTKDPGDQNTTFSEFDMANMVEDPKRRVSLLRSSQDTHMLAKTKEFDAMLESAKDPDALQEQMKAAYNLVYEQALGPNRDRSKHAAATEAATRATATQFHLLYYSGRGGNLKRAGGPKR